MKKLLFLTLFLVACGASKNDTPKKTPQVINSKTENLFLDWEKALEKQRKLPNCKTDQFSEHTKILCRMYSAWKIKSLPLDNPLIWEKILLEESVDINLLEELHKKTKLPENPWGFSLKMKHYYKYERENFQQHLKEYCLPYLVDVLAFRCLKAVSQLLHVGFNKQELKPFLVSSYGNWLDIESQRPLVWKKFLKSYPKHAQIFQK